MSACCFCASVDIFQRAVTLYKWKYYDDSIVELDKLILENKGPWSGRANFLKAYCLHKKGKTGDAEGMFTAMSSDAKCVINDYAKFALANISFDREQYEKALDLYRNIPAESALKIDANIKVAECLYEIGNYSQAIEISRSIILNNPDSASLDQARFNLGKCFERAKMPKEAIAAYHEINLYHPLSPLVKDCVSRINALSKRYKIYPDAASAEDIFNKAMVFYNFGDFNSAAFIFRNIVSNYRGSELWGDALFKLAMCDYKKRRMSLAIKRFKICVDNGGKNAAAAQFYLAFAYGKLGYFYQTLDCLNKVINNYPDSPYADQAAYYIGYYYEANGYKDTALDCYIKFVEKFPKSEFADDAYWKMGRLYYFKKDYAKACETFSKAVDTCGNGDWMDACAYWEGLCYEKMGNKWEAVSSYQFVVSRYDHTYYSYRAREKLASLGLAVKEASRVIIDSPVISETYGSAPETSFAEEPLPFESFTEDNQYPILQTATVKITNLNEHFIKYSELMAIGFYDEAAMEASLLIDNSPPDKKMSAKLAYASANLAAGKIRDSIIYAETLCNNSILYGTYGQLPMLTWQLAYPRGFYKHVSEYASEFGLDECLVLAVIREESRFNPKTVSWANARGLMQMIPETGRNVARLIGIRPYYTNKLHEPDINIRMGCYYLSQLMKRFDNNPMLALAAYNGGPLRVKKWMNKWWSEVGPDIDIDEFVESIPLSETKRYVQKVMKSYFEYKRLYSIKQPVQG
jgi:soluble lytic murein transglycosylase